jgi:hypothetical protein
LNTGDFFVYYIMAEIVQQGEVNTSGTIKELVSQ